MPKQPARRSPRALLSPLALLALLAAPLGPLAGCGPRYKPPEMVSFEQQMRSSELERLKGASPDLISDSLKYYERAKELHDDNEPEESEYYVTLASVTWRAAERRASYLGLRQRMATAKERLERAQALRAHSQSRRDALLQMEAERARLLRAQSAQTQAAMSAQRQQQEISYQQALVDATAAQREADALRAAELAAAPYAKAQGALKTAESLLTQGNAAAATQLARGAALDFRAAAAAARPEFERFQAREGAKRRMDELLRDAQGVRGGQAAMEGRGVVVSLRGLHSKGKLDRRQLFLLDDVATLMSAYPDVRVIIEAHTYSMGSRQKALAATERMADEALNALRPLLKSAEVKVSTLGRGDYAPTESNAKSPKNERLDFVFFRPRAD